MSRQTWVIETYESPLNKPHFFHRATRGKCSFLWTDEFATAMKFTARDIAQEWAKNNHLYCGYRIRSYPI